MPWSPLLRFSAPWEKLASKPFSFEDALKVDNALDLESLRELSGYRRIAVAPRAAGMGLEAQIEQLRHYYSLLSDFLPKLNDFGDDSSRKKLQFEWTSPTSGRPAVYLKIKGLQLELAMVVFLYGSSLRERAYSIVQDLWNGADDEINAEERGSSVVEAAKIFKEAAGLYHYLAETVLQPLQEELPGDRPAELVEGMSTCFEHMCLGEAQALTALRAEMKGSSHGLTASLHVGASDLFEQASKALKQETGAFNTVSANLRRFLAMSSSVEACRAFEHMAKDLLSDSEAGMAVACCEEANTQLQDCRTVAEGDAGWVAILDAEGARLQNTRAKCDKVRTDVLFQSVPKSGPQLLEGKILAKPSEYRPEEHRKRRGS